jgi:plastocyanin
VVRRHLIGARAAPFAWLALAVVVLAAAPTASGSNRRVAISNYRWSLPEVQIDLGEHVTWYWTGPDTMHSVTGDSAASAGLDSDPDASVPRHQVGDSFELAFDTPGTYSFVCKLHPTVRGTVSVSSSPGDPSTEVDPVPPSRVDLTPPFVDGMQLRSREFGRHGSAIHFGIDERAVVDAELYRLVSRRHRSHRGLQRRFAGWQQWHAHVGLNSFRFADRSRHFRPRPGRYRAVLRFTDASNNTARPRQLRFRIRG